MDLIIPLAVSQTDLTLPTEFRNTISPTPRESKKANFTLPLVGSRGTSGEGLIYKLHPSWTTLSKIEPFVRSPLRRSYSAPLPEEG